MKPPWRRTPKEAPAPPPAVSDRAPPADRVAPAARPGPVPQPRRPQPPQPASEDDALRQFAVRFFESAGVPLPGAPGPADTAWRLGEPPPGYLETFLTAEDLPGMSFAEDNRILRTFNED